METLLASPTDKNVDLANLRTSENIRRDGKRGHRDDKMQLDPFRNSSFARVCESKTRESRRRKRSDSVLMTFCEC